MKGLKAYMAIMALMMAGMAYATVFNDDFNRANNNSLGAPYTETEASPELVSVFNNFAHINDTDNTGFSVKWCDPTGCSNNLLVSEVAFDVYVSRNDRNVYFRQYSGTAIGILFRFGGSSNSFTVINGGVDDLQGFTANTWYSMLFYDINYTTHTYSVSINGTNYTDNQFSENISYSDYLIWQTPNTYGVVMDFDDVEITYEQACMPDWACSGYGACNASDYAPCNDTVDNNACGQVYSGNYSEFSPQACNYCSYSLEFDDYGICLTEYGYRLDDYTDLNFASCCNITGLGSDCPFSGNESGGVNVSCQSQYISQYEQGDVTSVAVDLIVALGIGFVALAGIFGLVWVFNYNRKRLKK